MGKDFLEIKKILSRNVKSADLVQGGVGSWFT